MCNSGVCAPRHCMGLPHCYCRGKCCREPVWGGREDLQAPRVVLVKLGGMDEVHRWPAAASGQSPCLCFCALT